MQPQSGPFRTLLSASAAYGLTDGGAWAGNISVTKLGRRIVRPTIEGDEIAAKREAFMTPRVPREFLSAYDGGKVPREDIARNVLAQKMAVPESETVRVFRQIIDDSRRLGLLTDIKGVEYVRLQGAGTVAQLRSGQEPIPIEEAPNVDPDGPEQQKGRPALEDLVQTTRTAAPIAAQPDAVPKDQRAGRVYVTHGKNKAFVDLLTKYLKYVDLEAVVSVERETVSLPVTDKVIGDMRSCGASIIHVDAERTITDSDGSEHVFVNENVLIEIGAAVALYGKRFILLVGEGVKLPSNLQGLYQVRYDGDKLDAEAGMRLLDAITDIKNHPLPPV